MADYNIGDTIRFKAIIKDFDNVEANASLITVSVYKLDKTALLTSTGGIPTSTGTGYYYQDWTVSTGLSEATKLIALWEWTSSALPHKKRMNFNVIPTI
jgi:hypothetical protein